MDRAQILIAVIGSAAIGAPVSSLITEVGKWRERQSRREELLLTKAIEMAQSRVSNVRESSVEPILRRLRQRKEPSYTWFK